MRYIGFNVDEEILEKIKVISFVTKKNRSQLIKEGLKLVIEKNSDSFDKFQNYIATIKQK